MLKSLRFVLLLALGLTQYCLYGMEILSSRPLPIPEGKHMGAVAYINNEEIFTGVYSESNQIGSVIGRMVNGKFVTDRGIQDSTTSVQSFANGDYMWTGEFGSYGWRMGHWQDYCFSQAAKRRVALIEGKVQRIDREHLLFYLVAKDGVLELVKRKNNKKPEIIEIKLSDTPIDYAAIQTNYPAVAFVEKDGKAGRLLFDTNSSVSLPEHNGLVHSISFSPDGSRVVTAGEDGVVHIADVVTGQSLRRIEALQNNKVREEVWVDRAGMEVFTRYTEANDILAAQLSHCGRFLATYDIMNKLKLWDVDTGGCVGLVPLLPGTDACSYHLPQLRFSPDDQKLLVYNHHFASEHELALVYKCGLDFLGTETEKPEVKRKEMICAAVQSLHKKRKKETEQESGKGTNMLTRLVARELGKQITVHPEWSL